MEISVWYMKKNTKTIWWEEFQVWTVSLYMSKTNLGSRMTFLEENFLKSGSIFQIGVWSFFTSGRSRWHGEGSYNLKEIKGCGQSSGAPFSSSNQWLLTEMFCPFPPVQTWPLCVYLSLPFESAKIPWDFPSGPVVKNPSYNAEDWSLIPGGGTKIPHASEQVSLACGSYWACMLQVLSTTAREYVHCNERCHMMPGRSKIF